MIRSLTFLGAFLIASESLALERPNVVVILTDDQGWGDLSLNGNSNLKTPHIDSIARDGASFERFFVQPVCSPTRAEFLTGRYHPRGGVRDVSTGGERLNLDETTIADCFKAAGYSTAAFGKWHNGSQYPYHPIGRGFTEYYGFTSGHWGDYFDPPLDHNGKLVQGKGFLADDLTDRAIAYCVNRRDRPFFCYLAYNTPHSPMQVPERFWSTFKAAELKLRHTGPQTEDLGHTRAALAMCENLDWNVGRLLKALDDQNLAKNTIVVFFHDNGPNGWRWNGGMKGRKGSTDEGGVRSPLLIRWSDQIKPARSIPAIAGAIDLLPTLTDLAQVKRVGDKLLDGVSFAPVLLGKKADVAERLLFQHWNGKVSVRAQTHRLDADGKLFDMVADPGQTKDVAANQPEVAKKLSMAAADYKAKVLAGLTKKDDRPFPVGHREFPVTTLPARDGVPHGAVMRSARAPNCSYFTNWSRLDDRITWPIEVATAGRYQIEIFYTCAKENVGAVIECQFKDARVSRKVDAVNDPPARGNENDRVPRTSESLVKDFKPWILGEMALERGRGELKLQALEISGKQAIEVRGVVLTLIKPN